MIKKKTEAVLYHREPLLFLNKFNLYDLNRFIKRDKDKKIF